MSNIYRNSILLICSLLLVCNLKAQEAQEKLYRDKVITQNGSVIIGIIKDYSPDDSVTIELTSGNTLKLTAQQVKRVVMYSGKHKDASLPLKSKKIFNETQFSILTGESGTGVSLAHNVMYQWNKYFAFGLGTGIDNYYVEPGRDIFPIFANAKLNMMNASSAPYIGVKVGYGMAFKNEAEDIFAASGGLMVNPYFGIRIGSRGMIFNMFSGLKFQKADYEIVRSFETRVEDILFRRLEIGTSVMF